MESAENIMALEADDLDTYQEEVTAQVMQIFEACSFQDITGQRISKVVETLQLIEARVQRLTSAIGIETEADSDGEELDAAEARRKALMLNGPQLDGEGVNQDDVDALFDGDGKTGDEVDQDDIDALFD